MKYLEMKKRAFMSIVNAVKGFVRNVSGISPITLPDCVDNDSLISYSISGNSVQNGEPTPENPIEVESVGEYDEETGKYKIPIKMSGKNLVEYPYSDTTKTINGITFTDNGDGTLTVNGTATANATFNIKYNRAVVWDNVFPNEEYTASIIIDGYYNGNVSFVINYYPEGSSSYTSWLSAAVNKPTTKDCPENIVGIRSYILIQKGTEVENLIIKPQLEKGETATVFESYIEPITTTLYIDEPLALGNVLKYPKNKIPKLPTIKGTTIYSIETAVQPSNMSAEYYSTSKGSDENVI